MKQEKFNNCIDVKVYHLEKAIKIDIVQRLERTFK